MRILKTRSRFAVALGQWLFLLLMVVGTASPASGGKRFEEFKARTRERFPGVSWISVETLDRWLKEKKGADLVLLDTRSREEYEVSHIASARLAPGFDEARRLLAGRAAEQLVVTYCSVGYRSAIMAQELGRIGFVNVHNLEGSLFEWANKGYPVYRNGVQVREVHFYNFLWGMYLNRELWAW